MALGRSNQVELEAIISAEDKASKTIAGVGKSFGALKIAGVAAMVAVGAAVTANIGNAVKRLDTLNNSARTFDNMGFSAEASGKAMKALEQSIRGLPTPLDSAVRGMTGLAATYGDVEVGQKVFTSLNNAILGFGGTAQMVDNAIQQLSQLPMDGPLDAQTWNSLRNSGLTPVLVAMSKDMGISVNEMKEKFGEGELTVKDFTDSLIKMNKEGGGGMKSLEQIVKDSTSGIGTAWANMNTAIAKGVANIMKSIGSEKISKAINDIGSSFEKALTNVGKFIEDLIPKLIDLGKQVWDYLGPKVEALSNSIKNAIPEFKKFAKEILGPVASTLGTVLVGAIGLTIDAFNGLVKVLGPLARWFSENKFAAHSLLITLGSFYVVNSLMRAFLGLQAAMSLGNAAFIANATSAAGLRGGLSALMGVLTSTKVFLLGPWAAAFAVVTGIVVAYKSALDRNRNATRDLQTAEENLAASRENLKQTQLDKEDAEIRIERAKIRVKEATENLMLAEQTHGAGSEEYQKAVLDKRDAELELERAKKNDKDVTDQLREAEQKVSSDEHVVQVERANAAKGRSFQGLTDAARNAESAMYAARDAGEAANKTTAPNGAQSTEFIESFMGRRSSGGPVSAGTPYVVGERGQEVFVPSQSGQIIPNDKLAKSSSNGGVTNINITVPMMTGSATERRKAAKMLIQDLQDIAAMNGQSVQSLLGNRYGITG